MLDLKSNDISHLSKKEKIELFEALKQLKILKARKNFLDFIQYTKEGYQTNWHHKIVADVLNRFVQKEIPRLMIFMPPRHGKSEQVSRQMPAYILGRNPDVSIIASSYGADLAGSMNRDVQRIIDSQEYRDVFPHVTLNTKNIRTETNWLKNSDVFEVVGHKGKYRSSGVGGAITGHGADFAIIDDPIKNQEEANSRTYRDKIYEWYGTTLLTRIEKNGSILLTMTRWHEDDLAGRLLQEAGWTILTIPAICDEEKESDPRKQGEALWPDKFPIENLEAIKSSIGSYYFSALYQQRPAPKEGNRFKLENFRYYTEEDEYYILGKEKRILKTEVRIYQTIDTAGTENATSDYFVCYTFGVTKEADIIVLDIYREQLDTTRHESVLDHQYHKWNPIIQAVENKTFGINIIQNAKKSGRPVMALKADNSKELRAEPLMVFYENHKVYHPEKHAELFEMENELLFFPNGKHDDIVDCAAYASQMVRIMQQRRNKRRETSVDYVEL